VSRTISFSRIDLPRKPSTASSAAKCKKYCLPSFHGASVTLIETFLYAVLK
jgi:hypothetical protein